MPWMLVRHKVEEYAKWKPAFDEHGAARKAIGSKGGYLFRNVDDPNEVVVLIDMVDLQKAREFVQSEDLRESMQKSGVADQPDVYLLDEVDRPSA
jgi:uncharacterized protein (DUF1330 family)